jgi:hypothetical protein
MPRTMTTETPLENSGFLSTGIFTEDNRNARKFREKLAAESMQKFQLAKNDRWRQERQWYLNLAFYFGQQHVVFKHSQAVGSNVTNFEFYIPPAPYYRVRPTINQTRKIIRRDISRLTSQKPNAYVVPASTEDRDVFAAQAGEQIWDSLWRKHKFNRIIRRGVFWQVVCGNGFLKQVWDPTLYDASNDLQGDVNVSSETPFHIFIPDLKEEELEDQPYVIHVMMKNPEWIKNNLGVDIGNQHKLDYVDESLLNVMGANQFSTKDSAPVVEVWYKPNVVAELPEGGVVTIVANQIVQGFEGWPYTHQQYPFSKLDAIPTGKFYTESIITDLIPLQRELNRTRGQIIEAKNKMSKPQLAAEEGSIDPRKITTEPGQVIEYKAGYAAPIPISLQNLPSYVAEELNRIYSDMADISGQHEVSQGSVPPGVTAATAISFLQEQDESLISSFYDSLEESIEKTAHQTLTYVRDYWDVPRLVRIVGIDGTFDAQTFKGSQLHDNTDIRVEAGSALPTSRAAKQAFILDLMKLGFIPPQEGLEVLEIGGLNRIYERLQEDTRQARRENLKMRVINEEHMFQHQEAWNAKPEEERIDPDTQLPLEPPLPVPVNTWDNHAIHIEIHNRYRKSQSFEMAEPLTRQLFEEHVKQHMEALMVGATAGIPGEMANPLEPPPGGEVPPGPSPEPELEMEGPPQL